MIADLEPVQSDSGTVDRLSDLSALDRVRDDWDAVHACDDHAHIFTSWNWLRAALETTTRRPLVLCFRPHGSSRYTAFLPLALSTKKVRGIPVRREIVMAGDPFADFTGMLSRPDCQAAAIDAFAAHLDGERGWDRFTALNVADRRVDELMRRFGPARYRLTSEEPMACVYVPLPSTWEAYLTTRLGSKTRQLLRKRMRQIEALPDFRTTYPDAATLDHHVDVLLRLRHERWPGDLDEERRSFGSLFRFAFEAGTLSLLVHWSGSEPVAAIAGFIDRDRGVYASYISGWNPAFAHCSPGIAIFGYTIRLAIENGLQIYDFLRGDESYKAAFGGEERFTTFHTLQRRTARAAFGVGIETAVGSMRRMVGNSR